LGVFQAPAHLVNDAQQPLRPGIDGLDGLEQPIEASTQAMRQSSISKRTQTPLSATRIMTSVSSHPADFPWNRKYSGSYVLVVAFINFLRIEPNPHKPE
jgi:hypothetical protein